MFFYQLFLKYKLNVRRSNKHSDSQIMRCGRKTRILGSINFSVSAKRPRISDPGPVSYSTPVRLDPNTSYFLGKTQSLFFENPPNISGQNISKYFKDTNYFYPIKDCLYKITT